MHAIHQFSTFQISLNLNAQCRLKNFKTGGLLFRIMENRLSGCLGMQEGQRTTFMADSCCFCCKCCSQATNVLYICICNVMQKCNFITIFVVAPAFWSYVPSVILLVGCNDFTYVIKCNCIGPMDVKRELLLTRIAVHVHYVPGHTKNNQHTLS